MQSPQGSGKATNDEPEREKKGGALVKLEQIWTKLGLDVQTLLLMAK